MIDAPVLAKQFRYWSLHVLLCAAPSFCFALIKFNSLSAVLGMLVGIATFIAGYTLLTASPAYQRLDRNTLIGRAVRLGTRIRVAISLLSGFLLLGYASWEALVFFAPDFWAGFLAVAVVSAGLDLLGTAPDMTLDNDSPGFFPTYLITITEGLILSFTLVFISFLVLLILQFRQNRRMHNGGAPLDS